MRFLVAVVMAVASLTAAPERALAAESGEDEVSACLTGHEKAQLERTEGKLLEAREKLIACSRDVCPRLIREDCARWFYEVDALVPSLIVAVREGSSDLTDAKLSIDDEPVSDTLDGRVVSLDPGRHKVTVTLPDGETMTKQILLAPGEKHRRVTFEIKVPGQEGGPGSPGFYPMINPERPMHRPVPKLTWILGGTAAALAVGGGVFGILALKERSDLARSPSEGGCKPVCSDGDLNALRRNARFSDLLTGASILTAAGALVTYLARPEVPLEEGEVEEEKESSSRGSVFAGAGPEGAYFGYTGTW